MTTDTKIEELIAEAREWPRDGVNEGRLINGLADALEQVTAERDAALSAIREALELVKSAPIVPIHTGGGNLVNRQKMVQASDIKRILSRALDEQEE